MTENRFFCYGGKRIDYALLYCQRESLEIAVHPDGTVVVKAPFNSTIERVERKLMKRARWIIRQQNYFIQFSPRTPERSYVNGETHLYLGKQYRLRILQSAVNDVKLTQGYFHVQSKDLAPTAVRTLLHRWYAAKAQRQFNESFERCWPSFVKFGVERPSLAIRSMKTRWGSLSVRGTMTLNRDIIKAPRDCIDYVVTHELCHMIVKDHSPQFYQLMDTVMPNWSKLKHRLELSLV